MATEHDDDVKGGAWLIEETDPGDVMTPEKLHRGARPDRPDRGGVHRQRGLPGLDASSRRTGRSTASWSQKCGALGLLGTNVPEAYGGVDLDKISDARSSPSSCRGTRRSAPPSARRPTSHPADLHVRHRGAEAEVPARPRLRRDGRRLLPQRVRIGLGRARRQGQGDAAGRRQLRPLRREDVDHQRRLRRRLRRLRQGGRRALHRLHRRARVAGRVERQGRAQDGPARLVDDAGDPAGREGAGRRRARRDRQGPQGRVQRAQLRPLQARRDVLGRRQGRASPRRRSTRRRASSSACRSPPSARSSTSSAR